MEKYGVPPAPGTPEAIRLGCTCPVIDNRYGAGMYKTKDGMTVYVYNSDCIVHGLGKKEKTEEGPC